MSKWKIYANTTKVEMRPYQKDEDMSNVSHPKTMTTEHLNKDMGMIMRDIKHEGKHQYIPRRMFNKYYKEIKESKKVEKIKKKKTSKKQKFKIKIKVRS